MKRLIVCIGNCICLWFLHHCYMFNLNYLPQDPLLKVFLPRLLLLGGWWTFERGGLRRSSWVISSVPLRGVVGPCFFTCHFLLPGDEVTSLLCRVLQMRHATLPPTKKVGASWSCTETIATVSLNKTSLFINRWSQNRWKTNTLM